ncbi:MAG: hypothetical protein AAF738_11455 [Bacteroidota bacterium]
MNEVLVNEQSFSTKEAIFLVFENIASAFVYEQKILTQKMTQ